MFLPAFKQPTEFQLTHSRGVRHLYLSLTISQMHFNSRTHVECDLAADTLRSVSIISTHALTWSAT